MGKRGPEPYIETPANKALRQRVLRLKRQGRPILQSSPKEAWIREFVRLWDQNAWESMRPPMSRFQYLKFFQLANTRVSEYRMYLVLFDACVAAGLKPRHVSKIPVRVMYRHRHLKNKPDELVAALAGEKASVARQAALHRLATNK